MVKTTGQWAKFSFYRPDASNVALAGDFTEWNPETLPMIPDGDGYWSLALRLPPGLYRFKYFADGQWFCDFASFGIEFGTNGPHALLRIASNGERDAYHA